MKEQEREKMEESQYPKRKVEEKRKEGMRGKRGWRRQNKEGE